MALLVFFCWDAPAGKWGWSRMRGVYERWMGVEGGGQGSAKGQGERRQEHRSERVRGKGVLRREKLGWGKRFLFPRQNQGGKRGGSEKSEEEKRK